MPNRRTQIISLIATILIVGGFVLAPHYTLAAGVTVGTGNTAVWYSTSAHASSSAARDVNGFAVDDNASCGFSNMGACVNVVLVWLINNIVLPTANLFLVLAGVLLNGVMILTLNMSSLVNMSGGVVEATWSVIRDMSSIVIIFFLLYISIRMIIGQTDTKLRHIIVMVVVAGILLNFSLFFTKIAIDASNLVSLAFYRAIAPNGANFNLSQPSGQDNLLKNAFTQGGISDEFMKALKIQKTYSVGTSTLSSLPNTNPISIITAGLGGAIIMIIAALVFLAGALLFAVRIGILIILMAFSPVYFIGFIIPEIEKKVSKKWFDALLNQCLIMPIYMIFMYVALRVITNPSFQGVFNPTSTSGGTALFLLGPVGVVMEYIIGLILIILPLIAALEYASVGKDFVQSSINKVKKYGSDKLSNIPSNTLRNTVGRGAALAQDKFSQSKYAAANPNLALMVNKATGVVAGTSWGGAKGGFAAAEKKRLETQDKNRKDTYERLGNVHREDYKTDDDFDKARRAALGRQGQFVTNLRSNSILSHMTGGRNIGIASNPFNVTGGANLRSAGKLGKVQEKAEAKEYKKDNQEEMKRNNAEINELKGKLGAGSMLFDRSGKEITRSDAEKKGIQKRIDELENKNEDLKKRLNRADQVEKEEDKVEQAKATAKAIKDQEKESGGGEEPKAKPSAPKPATP